MVSFPDPKMWIFLALDTGYFIILFSFQNASIQVWVLRYSCCHLRCNSQIMLLPMLFGTELNLWCLDRHAPKQYQHQQNTSSLISYENINVLYHINGQKCLFNNFTESNLCSYEHSIELKKLNETVVCVFFCTGITSGSSSQPLPKLTSNCDDSIPRNLNC